MKIILERKFENLNEIIRSSRGNYHYANLIKRKEMDYVRLATLTIPKVEEYPVKITFIWHVKNKNRDLDNMVGKSILDGLVRAKILKNDNLSCIQEITYKAIIDNEEMVEIIIDKK